MIIEKLSKCIYVINGKRIDTRKKLDKTHEKFKGVRQALFLYFVERNPNINWYTIDVRVSNFINRNHDSFWALEYNTIYVK